MNTPERRYDLDWLRVIVILTVFVFHSTRFFNLYDWHVKNASTYVGVEIFEQVLVLWMMPLCFVISGAGVYFALGRGQPGKFVADKVLRLAVPLGVGIFTHAAFQVYLERRTHGDFTGSFWQFYPHYFAGLYPYNGGNFAWIGMHLWYLELLFVFCLALLPLLWWLRRGGGQAALARLGGWLAVPGVALLLVLPVVLVLNLVPEDSLLGDQGLGGWSLLSHLWFFVSGFVIASHSRIQHSLERLRWVWLLAALALTGGQIALWAARGASGYDFEFEHTDLLSYLWMFAWLGFAGRHLRFSTPLLQRANEAVLPFYILHQTVLLSVGYFGVRWAMPDGARWAAITVISLALCLGLYEWLIRRFNALRFLFGMKPLARPAAVAARSPVAAAEPTH